MPLRALIEAISHSSTRYGPILGDIGGNLVLFAPLGVLAPFLWPHVTRRASRVGTVAGAVALGVEVVQWLMAKGRAASIDDVVLAVAGAVLADAVASPGSLTGPARAAVDVGERSTADPVRRHV